MAPFLDVAGKAKGPGAGDDAAQQRLALQVRQRTQVEALESQQVEQVEDGWQFDKSSSGTTYNWIKGLWLDAEGAQGWAVGTERQILR